MAKGQSYDFKQFFAIRYRFIIYLYTIAITIQCWGMKNTTYW